MDKLAEKLARWFGSAPFIVFHIVWFTAWTIMNFLVKFDPEWSILTIIVSLEAIFLSLFILRAENVEADRQNEKLKLDVKTTKQILKKLDHSTRKKQ